MSTNSNGGGGNNKVSSSGTVTAWGARGSSSGNSTGSLVYTSPNTGGYITIGGSSPYTTTPTTIIMPRGSATSGKLDPKEAKEDPLDLHEHGFDIETKTFLMMGSVDDQMLARTTSAFETFKRYQGEEVTILLSTEGGNIYDGLGICDLLDWYKLQGMNISIIGLGYVMSMGSVILQCASPGMRFLLPSTTVMVHQGSQSLSTDGHPEEHKRTQKEFDRIRKIAFSRIAKSMGVKSYATWAKAHRFDKYYSADEAVAAKLADMVITETKFSL